MYHPKSYLATTAPGSHRTHEKPQGAGITAAGLAKHLGHAEANTPENLGISKPAAVHFYYTESAFSYGEHGEFHVLQVGKALTFAVIYFIHTDPAERRKAEERAAFIVRACNSYSALVEALEGLFQESAMQPKCYDSDGRGQLRYQSAVDQARAALAAAKANP